MCILKTSTHDILKSHMYIPLFHHFATMHIYVNIKLYIYDVNINKKVSYICCLITLFYLIQNNEL